MNLKSLIREEIDDFEWIKDINESDMKWIENVEAKWDIYNIHLVAGKKFHLTSVKFTADAANKIYWFSDETKPNQRDIKICWEDSNLNFSLQQSWDGYANEHSVECGKVSTFKVIDLLNKNDWILLDDVIIEPNEEMPTPPLSESDKITNSVNESDDFDWIRDIEPPSFDSLVGKALEFEPYIDNMVDLKKILEVLSGMGFTYGPWADDVLLDAEQGVIVGLYLDPINNKIIWTGLIDEDYEEHISEWVQKPVEVLDGWITLGDFLYSNKKKL